MSRVTKVAASLAIALGFAAAAGHAQPPALNSVRVAATAPQTATAATVAQTLPPPPASPTVIGVSGVAPIAPATLEAFVDGAVRASMANQHIAGVAVAVVQNGQVLLKKGYGVSRLDPATPVDPDRTLFRLGSLSQSFTWVALMKEVEAGHIRPTEPINLYLPEKLQIKDQGFKRPIVVRDLMTHTPGFEDRALGQLFEQDPRRVRPLGDYLREERPRRVREAGSVPVFSNYGAALAGAAVAYVNGHRYQDVIDSEILQPLGMTRTTVREPYPPRADLPTPMPASLAQDVSAGYRWAGGRLWAQDFEYATQAAPAAAASSTAGDMALYMQMILNGGQLGAATVFGPDTARGFVTTTQASAPGMNGWDNGFLETSLPGGYRGQGQSGDTLWFHSNMVTVPALGLGVFVATNTDTGAALARALPRQIVAQFYGPADMGPRPGAPALADQAAVYAGTYLNERRAYGGLEKFINMLAGQVRVSVTSEGHLLTRGGGFTSGLWTPDGPAGRFTAADGPDSLVFDIENGGRARRWFAPDGATAYDRAGLLHRAPTLAALAFLTAIASIATIVGVFTRDRRDFRQTPYQARAGLVQNTVSVLWLLALTTFGLWGLEARDPATLMYDWPGALLLIASACAFVAALLTALTIAMAPMVWRGGRRLDSWTSWRKLRFSVSTAIFAAFSVVLLLWGALEPWSG